MDHASGFILCQRVGAPKANPPKNARRRRRQCMSEENKALARRSWEIVSEESLETLEDALQEVYAPAIVMHEPAEDVRGIEGLTQFVSMIRSALPDLRVTLEDDIAEGNKVVSRWRAQGTP